MIINHRVKMAALLVSLSSGVNAVPKGETNQAQPEQKPYLVGEYFIEGKSLHGVAMQKICAGDQLYWITLQSNGPSAMTPALRDGKPETCSTKEP